MARRFRLPLGVEVLLVQAICFGPFVYWSLLELLGGETDEPVALSDAALVETGTLEVVIGLSAGVMLLFQGRRLANVRAGPSWRGFLGGAALAALAFAIYVAASWLGALAGLPPERPWRVTVSFPVGAAFSVVNAYYEEGFVLAYLVHALEGRTSAWRIVALSVAIRTGYHLYQGPFAVLYLAPLGVAFALAYLRWRSLFAVAAAHALIDVYALASLAE